MNLGRIGMSAALLTIGASAIAFGVLRPGQSISSADAAGMGAMPVAFLAILVTSYIAWHKLSDKSPVMARN